MKPRLFVIAMSHAGQAGDTVRTLDVAGEFPFPAPLAQLRAAHKFDYSSEELSAILEWRRLERRAA